MLLYGTAFTAGEAFVGASCLAQHLCPILSGHLLLFGATLSCLEAPPWFCLQAVQVKFETLLLQFHI